MGYYLIISSLLNYFFKVYFGEVSGKISYRCGIFYCRFMVSTISLQLCNNWSPSWQFFGILWIQILFRLPPWCVASARTVWISLILIMRKMVLSLHLCWNLFCEKHRNGQILFTHLIQILFTHLEIENPSFTGESQDVHFPKFLIFPHKSCKNPQLYLHF